MLIANLPQRFVIGQEVTRALQMGAPLVALESAVITHGLPRPQNLELARDVQTAVRSERATPATIGVLNGQVVIGLNDDGLDRLANAERVRKISRRDFGIALTRMESGGTTVAGTLIAARAAGLRIFATGGIGGVHRNSSHDVSTDLFELSRSPLIVVCSGAKAVLDLAATREVLETLGVPVVGYQTEEFPAFYSRHSGLAVDARVETPQEVADIARMQWESGVDSAVLVVVPPPDGSALSHEQVERVVGQAMQEAQTQQIRGAAVTPFLLSRVAMLTGGNSLEANLSLLRNNAKIAAQIAVAYSGPGGMRVV